MNTVSIIIPIYNAALYIEACLDSIQKQTYRLFEVILVDDGSTDASGLICDLYAKKDKRFTVYHRKNAGVSASRNFGLAHASGKYILFVDADDTIDPGMLSGCVQLAEKNQADLVICSFRYYMTDENNRVVENSLGSEACVSPGELFDHWFMVIAENEILNPPWNKFIRKDLLDANHIRFHEEFSICEDMKFSIQTINASKRVVLTGNMYYNYYLKSTGTLVFKFHENYYEALTCFYHSAYQYCNKFEHNSNQLRLLHTIYVNLIMMFVKQICTISPWNKATRYGKMKAIGGNPNFLHAIVDADLNRRRKLICFLLKKGWVSLISVIYLSKDRLGRISGAGNTAVKAHKMKKVTI